MGHLRKIETSNWLNQSISSITYILYFNINIYTNLNIFILFYIKSLYYIIILCVTFSSYPDGHFCHTMMKSSYPDGHFCLG